MSGLQRKASTTQQFQRKEAPMNPFWESVRMTVCRKCIDGDNNGNCRLPGNERCMLEVHFSPLLEMLSEIRSHSMEPYVSALRTTICPQCEHMSADGSCHKRAKLECALDRYYPLIIEKVHSMKMYVE